MNIVRTIAVVTGIALLGFACGNSAPADNDNNAPENRGRNVLRWDVITTTPPRTLKVGGAVGYCVGDPRPTIGRPQIRYRGEDVYIRLEHEIPREKRANSGRCAGVELFVRKAITLRRDLSDVKIYDSGIEPPELHWP